MTLSHDEALERLLASPARGGAVDAEASDHVARCSSCWAVVRACHHAQAGSDPIEAERMAALFGCNAVRDELYMLAADPDAAPLHLGRHVGWCADCRERLLELLAFARAEATWRDVVARLVVRIGNGVAAFAAVADELRVLATVAGPVPVRGPAPAAASSDGWTGQPALVAVRFGTHGGELSAAVAADGEGRVRLTIEPPRGVAVVALRAVGTTGERLVASQAVGPAAPVVFRQVPVGRYRVTLAPSGAVVALDVVPAS